MALTAVEEGQLRDLLAYYSGLSDVAMSSSEILAALDFGDVRVVDLDSTPNLNPEDVFYCAQAGADVKISFQQMSDYIASVFTPIIEAAVSDAKFYFTGQF